MTRTHERAAVAALADEHFARQCELDPVRATLAGVAGHDDALPDYTPDGWAERAALCRATEARLPGGGDRLERVLAERLAAEAEHGESGLAAALNVVVAPPTLVRECLVHAAPEGEEGAIALLRRLRAVPTALDGYARTVVAEAARGRAPSRTQAEVVAGACRAWAADGLFVEVATTAARLAPRARDELVAAAEAAAAGYLEFAEAVEQRVLPGAVAADGVGAERYRVAARHVLGVDLDPVDTAARLAALLEELGATAEAVARDTGHDGDLRAVCAELDRDRVVTGADGVCRWLRDRLDRSADLVAGVLTVPDGLRRVEAVVRAEAGPVRYLPPAADGSRPGQVVWPLPADQDTVPVWNQLTAVHHEGVPGHHLQMGAAVLDEGLSAWQRHTTVPGHAEGWAVYAEGLMGELGALDEPTARLGYVLGRRLNAAVALTDLSVHTGVPLPGGAEPFEFLASHAVVPAAGLYFTLLRNAAWPAQALSYECGAHAWERARAVASAREGAAFDLHHFHTRMLGLGPCGLSALVEEAGS